ncbi:hypothetical protein COBT_001573, partial [Conglomerata obtusa]
ANLDCLLQNKIKTRRLLASRKPNTRKSVIDKNEPFTAKQSNNVLTSGKQLQVITSTNLNAISAEQNAMSYNNHNDFTNKKKRILQCNNLCPNLKIKNSDSEFQLKSTTELKHNNESSSTQITEKTQTCIDHYEYNKNTNRYIYISKKCTRNRVLPLDQYKIVTTKIRDLAMPILESLDLIEYVNNISILEQSSSTDTNYYFHIYKITSINNLDYKPTVDYVVRIISNNNQYKLRIAEEKAVAKKIIKNDHYKILYQHYANFTLVTQLICIEDKTYKAYSIVYENFISRNMEIISSNTILKDIAQLTNMKNLGEPYKNIQSITILILQTEQQIQDILYEQRMVINTLKPSYYVIIDTPQNIEDEFVNHFVNINAILFIKEGLDYEEFLQETDFFDTLNFNRKEIFKHQINTLCGNFLKLDFDYIQIVDIINDINIDCIIFKKNLNVSTLQQYLIKYIKSIDYKNPIHFYVCELQFFGLYLENTVCEKDLYVPVQELVRYLHVLYIFTILTKILVPINFSQLSDIYTCEFKLFLQNPMRLVFLSIRHELQRLFAHIISIFITENCLEVFIEKYLTERLFFTFFNKDIKYEKENNRISIFGKNSNCFILSRLFFIFFIKNNTIFKSILHIKSFDEGICFFACKILVKNL